jgi:hypothetical protein
MSTVLNTMANETTERIHLCADCVVGLRGQKQRHDCQFWSCLECGAVRKWGDGQPADRYTRPALKCSFCEAVTRHGFLGVAGQLN